MLNRVLLQDETVTRVFAPVKLQKIFFFKDDLLLYCLAASRPLLEQI